MKNPITTVRVVRTFLAAASLLCLESAARASYQTIVLADHPLAFYALNPAVDGDDTAPDLSGNGNDGIAVGIATATGPSSYIPNAANFNGQAAIDISQGNNPGLLIYNGPLTLEAWVQPNSSSLFGDIIAQGYENATGYPEIALRANSGNYFGGSENANFSTYVGGGAETTNWCYVVLSMDGTNITLYQNGELVGVSADTNGSTVFPTPDDWVIGNGSDQGASRLFDGNISEVAMYNYGLTAAQVLLHYNEGMYGSSNAPTPTSGPSLKWSGVNNSGTWDTGSSTNWINVTNSQETVFAANDSVLFDDTTGAPTSVTVSGTVSPFEITVNSSVNNYTISGGTIGGTGGLNKEGSSTLTIDTVGLVGPVTIGGGAISAGNNSLDAASSITISNGATLDLAGGSFSADTPITVAGQGINNEGAIYNSYSDYPGETLKITMTGDTKFGGSARWDMDDGSISGPHNLLVDWSNLGGYGQWNGVTIGSTVEDINVTNSSTIGMTGMDDSCQSQSTLFNFYGGQLVLYSGGFNGSFNLANGAQAVIYNGNLSVGGNISVQNGSTVSFYSGNVTLPGNTLHFYGGSTANLYGAGFDLTGSSLIFEDGAFLQTFYNGGNNSIANQVTFNGVAHFVLGDHTMTFNGAIGGAGGFVLDYYNNDFIFTQSNSYTGPTIIGSGGNSPAVALTGNGSISDSSLIFFGGSDPAVMHIDVSGRSDQTLTLGSGQTLGGIGGINGSLVESAGSTVSPAGTNTTIGITTGSSAVGTLAASANVALHGTTIIKLDGNGTNDAVEAAGTLTYGGTLELENVSGSALAGGNSFQIFTAASISGSFASITPATPGAGLTWNTSQLGSGIISVQAVPTGPTISAPQLSGNNITLSGTGGTDNAQYVIYTTTNLAGTWTPVATNNYSGTGTFSATIAVTPGAKQQFFMIR